MEIGALNPVLLLRSFIACIYAARNSFNINNAIHVTPVDAFATRAFMGDVYRLSSQRPPYYAADISLPSGKVPSKLAFYWFVCELRKTYRITSINIKLT